MRQELIDLDWKIKDATEALLDAANKAEDIAISCERGWKEMNDLHAIIKSYGVQMSKVIKPEIRKAINEAIEENDRLSDLADGQSY